MKRRTADPPASHEKILDKPSRRLGRGEGGGSGYVRGGITGAEAG